MKKIDNFTNQYSLSKTLRFSLIPIGKTEENFNNALLLKKDKERAQKYDKVKGYIDRYHKYFIDDVLSEVKLENIKEYAELYFKSDKTEKDIKNMDVLEAHLRKAVSSSFLKDERYKSLFEKEMIEKILPSFLTSKDELDDVLEFRNFTTYFTGFHNNRKNMYSADAHTTSISYRCINENLPRFLDNTKKFDIALRTFSDEVVSKLNDIAFSSFGVQLADIFNIDFYTFVLSQTYIDKYNSIIGGYTDEKGNKIQGLNEYINLCNQQVAKTDKSARLPFFTPLHKQILSDRDTISVIPEKFSNDEELLKAVKDFCVDILPDCLNEAATISNDIDLYDFNGIFVSSLTSVNEISNAVFGHWNAVVNGWRKEYENHTPLKANKSYEKYTENMDKALKSKLSFSLTEIQQYGEMFKSDDCIGNISEYLKNTIIEKTNVINTNYTLARELLTSEYKSSNENGLKKDKKSVTLLKNLLDSIKDLEYFLKLLKGTGKEENKDFSFYGNFTRLYEALTEVDLIYDKVRNYVTQKPYSNDKIKLNFDNSQHLGGWDKNKERDYRTIILRKNNEYYLAVMTKNNNKMFIDPPLYENGESWKKMEYKLLPGPNKMLPKVFFATSNAEIFKPDKEILEIRKKETFKKGTAFNIDDCHKLIDFFKESINNHNDWSQFKFRFSPTESYDDISEFYNEVKQQGYMIKFQNIPDDYINNYVEAGELYLFKIYSKDFSKFSHGKKNLHTMYFKMLFDEINLSDVVYQLNGGAEMFYREASIGKEEMTVHKSNEPIQNKNTDNPKKTSTFKYDIIKDKRYTKRQFSVHLPITLNFKAKGNNYINNDVRLALKNTDNNYVIGIDRGERNLLYICVVDGNGEIVEQKSLNEIISDNNYKVDYHKLLDAREKERDNARKNWNTVENIKELKEGYLSQVIHQICEYVVKYDAIIAMEDLNFGFKKGRFKVEKQVYQKFENMLCEKLKYLVRKDEAPENPGGLLNAYQLTNHDDKYSKKQNGIIFYVPAWLTSKIDPVTGFVDLLKPVYTGVKASLEFIKKIDDIRFNADEKMLEFDIDYSKFPKASLSYRKKWTVCTNGERIVNERNREKNNMWDSKTIVLTDEFEKLFASYNIDFSNNIKENILKITDSNFHKKFIKLLAYTLQLRNSMTGNTDIDYLLSPVKDSNGVFFDSRKEICKLPKNADANGAYNIARKALWTISVLKDTDAELLKDVNLSVKNSAWLEYAQK